MEELFSNSKDFNSTVEETPSNRASVRTLSRRIHILGVGNIGKFVAHSLAGVPNPPPITLLLRRRSQSRQWVEEGQAINLVTHGVSEKRTGFNVESAIPTPNLSIQRQQALQEPIHHLIVTTKATHTVQALQNIKHRLTPDSSIVFLQNGMGILDEVNESVFPDPDERPNYLVGIISHGVFTKASYFSAVHAGFGTTSIGALPRTSKSAAGGSTAMASLSSRYLLRTVTRTPVLAAVGFSPIDLAQLQLEKLAINAIINPLTAVMNCRNGDILHNVALTRTMRLLLSEISLVIRSLPELQGVPNVDVRFSSKRLEAIVIGTANKTANNISSMLQDTRHGNLTEIDYINGYIVRRGEMMGIRCVMNYMILQMVKGKSNMEHTKGEKMLPFE
ncbi:MAG: hypothetical protein M4579_004704 [Chaenotheca gracillima]|nr:MAG: hypothetical protein M4579_004704 [Chaenotheca gracillima]